MIAKRDATKALLDGIGHRVNPTIGFEPDVQLLKRRDGSEQDELAVRPRHPAAQLEGAGMNSRTTEAAMWVRGCREVVARLARLWPDGPIEFVAVCAARAEAELIERCGTSPSRAR